MTGCPESTPAIPDASSADVPRTDTGPSGSDAGDPVDAGAAGDAEPVGDSGVTDAGSPIDVGPLPTVERVDILFMIDNSGSMSQEQASLQAEMPALINALARGQTPGGTAFDAVTDLRVGVVTSDMGSGGFTIPTCNEPNFGDDGILHRGGECIGDDAPPYLALRPESEVGPFGTAAQCLVSQGTQGCGFEQQLDAVLKAVTPAGSAVRFVNGSLGHGNTINEDFVRDDSLLVIVMLTDEDDCSASNPDIFNRDSGTFTDPDLNLRCWRYGDVAVHPIRRYVDGLLAVHPPERLIYHLVAGIPVDLASPIGESPNYELLIGPEEIRDPRMVLVRDPEVPSQLRASCDVVGRGQAYPPERLVGVAEGLERAGAGVIIQSICQEEFSFAETLSSRIALYR